MYGCGTNSLESSSLSLFDNNQLGIWKNESFFNKFGLTRDSGNLISIVLSHEIRQNINTPQRKCSSPE